MRAAEIMTRDVRTTAPDASIEAAMRVMLDLGISGLPVVDPAGRLVGIVTEGDFLRRAELGTERRRPRWLEFLLGPGRIADEYVHARGRKVAEVMTDKVASVGEDAAIDEKIRANSRAVIAESRAAGILPRAAAMALAERRIAAAARTRRWG